MNIDIKKTEKLVSALYLITGFFDEKEPMKWHLRQLGGQLLSNGHNPSLISDITSLLRVSHNAGLISDTNFEIIHREFSALLPQGQLLSEVLKHEELSRPVDRPAYSEIRREVEEKISIPASVTPRLIKDKISRTEDSEGPVAQKKNGRQAAILTLLKKKHEIMVRDLTTLISGVSEKTIQRELLAMVSKGILKKEGEKRWSRYTLA